MPNPKKEKTRYYKYDILFCLLLKLYQIHVLRNDVDYDIASSHINSFPLWDYHDVYKNESYRTVRSLKPIHLLLIQKCFQGTTRNRYNILG